MAGLLLSAVAAAGSRSALDTAVFTVTGAGAVSTIASGLAHAELAPAPWRAADTRALLSACDAAHGAAGGDGRVGLGDVKALFGPLVFGQSLEGPELHIVRYSPTRMAI